MAFPHVQERPPGRMAPNGVGWSVFISAAQTGTVAPVVPFVPPGATYTLVGNLSTVLSATLTNVRAYLIPERVATVVADGTTRFGGLKIDLAPDLTFSVVSLPTGNYRLRIDYASAGSGWREQTWISATFAFTTTADIDALI